MEESHGARVGWIGTTTGEHEGFVCKAVIKSYDPGTGDGVVVRDTDLADIDLAPGALDGSVFRMLRQGQRVVFDLDADGRAASVRMGSEVDMGTPGFPPASRPLAVESADPT